MKRKRRRHVPVEGLALILGIDRFMSEARALTNLVGNGVATVVIARWMGDLDHGRLALVLDSADAGMGGPAESLAEPSLASAPATINLSDRSRD